MLYSDSYSQIRGKSTTEPIITDTEKLISCLHAYEHVSTSVYHIAIIP